MDNLLASVDTTSAQKAASNQNEPILRENPDRFVLFPYCSPRHLALSIKRVRLTSGQQKKLISKRTSWTGIINSTTTSAISLNMCSHSFAASDGIVNENLAENFVRETAIHGSQVFLRLSDYDGKHSQRNVFAVD
jgi:ribonucleoside-diphosphate reductase beta chain